MKSSDISGNLINSEGAVAEVLDFVTIMGILILSFSMIALAGYPILRSAQETRYIENTAQSFVVMADNLNKIALGQSPSQSVELKIYGGTLSTSMNSTIKINATNSTGQIIPLIESDLGSIENTVGDNVVAYQGTGVWVKYKNGATFNSYRPLITNRNNILVIPVVIISGSSSVGGTGVSRIRAQGTPSVTSFTNVSNITITITGNYVSGWKDFFRTNMQWYFDQGSSYTGQLNTTNIDVYIMKTTMYTEIQ